MNWWKSSAFVLVPLVITASTLAQGPQQKNAKPAQNGTNRGEAKAKGTALIPKDDIQAIALMESLLEAWGKRSQQYTALSATFTREDKDKVFNDAVRYDCVAYLKSPNLASIEQREVKKPALARKFDRRAITDRDELVVCDGKNVIQYKGATKQVFLSPLDKDARVRALEEGPLPFLFNMQKDKAKRRFRFYLRLDDEKTNSWFIEINPILAEDKKDISVAWLRLNKKTFLPDMVHLTDPDGNSQIYRFKEINVDLALDDAVFKAVPKPEKWELILRQRRRKGCAKSRPQQAPEALNRLRGLGTCTNAGLFDALFLQVYNQPVRDRAYPSPRPKPTAWHAGEARFWSDFPIDGVVAGGRFADPRARSRRESVLHAFPAMV